MDYNIIQGVCSLTRTGEDYNGTLPVKYTSYKDGGIYICKTDVSGTTDIFLNLNGIGAKLILDFNGADASLSATAWYVFLYEASSDKFYVLTKGL